MCVKRIFSIMALAISVGLVVLSPVFAAKRVAFVVGIDTYDNLGPEDQLSRTTNDAKAVSEALQLADFQGNPEFNLTRSEFNKKWQEFLEKIQPEDTVAFYFSGHGVEIEGLNYLLPRDVPFIQYGRQAQLRRESLAVSEFLLDLWDRKPRVVLFILDACRDNPMIPPEYRGKGAYKKKGGLAKIEPLPKGTFIMYSADSSQIALESLPGKKDKNPNSVYTRVLVPLLKTPKLSIVKLAVRLRQKVEALAQTVNHEQSPSYSDKLSNSFNFCLNGCGTSEESNADQIFEIDFWRGVKEINKPSYYKEYLKQFPSGIFAEVAKLKLEELSLHYDTVASLTPQEKKQFQGVLTLVRFNDPVYFLQNPISWSPKPGSTNYDPVTVPAGFVTDLASIPSIFWSILRPDGEYTYAAIVHDYLYWSQTRSREEADNIFKLILEEFGLGSVTTNVLYSAVRLGGGAAWDHQTELKAKGEKRILKRFPQDPRITWEKWKKSPDVFVQ